MDTPARDQGLGLTRRVAAHALVFALILLISVLALRWRRPEMLSSTTQPEAGSHVVFVLVVSSSCRSSQDRTFVEDFHRLAALFESRGTAVRKIGLSIDADSRQGLQTLESMGEFNEIAVGGGWENTAALAYVIRDAAGMAMVPQVVLLSRRVDSVFPLRVAEDSLISRISGHDQLRRWVMRLSASSSQRVGSSIHTTDRLRRGG